MTAPLHLVPDDIEPGPGRLLVDEAPPALSPVGDTSGSRFTPEAVSARAGVAFVLSAVALAAIVANALAFQTDPTVAFLALACVVAIDAILCVAEVLSIRARQEG